MLRTVLQRHIKKPIDKTSQYTIVYCLSKTGVTYMRQEKEFRAAREAFRRDQQS